MADRGSSREIRGNRTGLGLCGTLIGADYTDDETEFILAMEEFMTRNRRRFPTFTEVLAVAKSLGYRKVKDTGDSTGASDDRGRSQRQDPVGPE